RCVDDLTRSTRRAAASGSATRGNAAGCGASGCAGTAACALIDGDIDAGIDSAISTFWFTLAARALVWIDIRRNAFALVSGLGFTTWDIHAVEIHVHRQRERRVRQIAQ